MKLLRYSTMALGRMAAVAAVLCTVALGACTPESDLDESDDEEQWRLDNTAWYEAQKLLTEDDGTPTYQTIVPTWNSGAEVLMHWGNDRTATAGNLQPLETSTVDIKYKLTLYDGTEIDSSYALTDSTYRTRVTAMISGMQIALQYMHVGDSVRLLVPYQQGYGTTVAGNIPASSTLVFDVKLKSVYRYQLP